MGGVEFLLAVSVSLLATIGFIRLGCVYAPRLGLVDVPSGHKVHKRPVPVIGGLAVYLGLWSGFLLFLLQIDDVGRYLALLGVGGVLVVLGLLDDLKGIGVAVRFAAQITVGLLMTLAAAVTIRDLGFLVGDFVVLLGIFAVPFTVFAVVGGINAMNLIDGSDGLGGLIALISFAALATLAAFDGRLTDAYFLAMVLATIVGFLAFNLRGFGRRHAMVFMGNSGSMLFGLAITWFLVSLSQGEGHAMAPVTALWVFALPLMDTVAVMTLRLRQGRSPFRADRRHFHHLLMTTGFSANQILVIAAVLHAVMAGIGVVAAILGIAEWKMFYLFAAVFFAYYLILARSWSRLTEDSRLLIPERIEAD